MDKPKRVTLADALRLRGKLGPYTKPEEDEQEEPEPRRRRNRRG